MWGTESAPTARSSTSTSASCAPSWIPSRSRTFAASATGSSPGERPMSERRHFRVAVRRAAVGSSSPCSSSPPACTRCSARSASSTSPDSGRDSIRERVGKCARSAGGESAQRLWHGEHHDARRRRGARGRPGASPLARHGRRDACVTTRKIAIGAQRLVSSATRRKRGSTDSLRSLHRGLWIGVPLAVLADRHRSPAGHASQPCGRSPSSPIWPHTIERWRHHQARCRSPTPTTRSSTWRAPSTTCSIASPRAARPSANSPPTPPTNCGRR